VRRLLAWAAAGVALTAASAASAQFGGMGGGRGPAPQQAPQKPKEPTPEENEEVHNAYMRSEPEVAPPADPLAISPEQREQMGSDWASGPPGAEGTLERKWFPYYEERRGDYRLRMVPPFFIEHTRGLRDPSQQLYGVPKTEDTQGLYGLLYYRRRSLNLDMDVVFPAFWRVRDRDNHVVVAGPVVHREAPGEHDNWLAPLYFEGGRKEGGYFHAPLLLTTSHWGPKGAFTLVGPYFRDRTGTDVSMGVVPFYFSGDNHNVEGNRRTYTLIPPLLTYHAEHELDGSSITVVGPVIARDNPKRSIFDVAPFYFHIVGKPETGGVVEEHTTLFPFFHYGRDPEQELLVLPGYYRRVTHHEDTLLSLFYSHATTRDGATSFTAAGPVLPIWWNYTDRDLGVHAWAVTPLFFTSDSPAGHDWLTPLVGRFETYGQSRTWWAFPTFTFNSNTRGWENALHPIVYVGRDGDSTHTVVAPVFWDFADPKSRTTVAFPLYWRFAQGQNDSVVQVAANTLYMQKKVAGGSDWQFHLLPLFSYGEDPNGYFWNVLFGLAGYTREGASSTVRAFWIPFHSGPAAPPAQAATR
jgi:hypothetical protein